MKTLAQTTQHTIAAPEAIFALWAGVNSWAEYDKGIEWAKLDDSFVVGGTYKIKPKGGPVVKATILEIEPSKRFVDVSHLMGAKMTFVHTIEPTADGANITLVMTLSGPMTWLWEKILGKDQQKDLEASTAQLIATAEGRA